MDGAEVESVPLTPSGSEGLILLVGVVAALLLVLLIAALLIGSHRRYRMAQERLHAKSRRDDPTPERVDPWTQAGKRLDPADDEDTDDVG